jgi:NitT/TauT family transport system substrate-binding protein
MRFRLLVLLLLAGACGGGASDAADGELTVDLGYFPNLTHATAIVGDHEGIFAAALGDGVALKTSFFNAGPEAIEALFAGAIDATFIGPNPAINAYAQSDGAAVRLVSGATSGGAFLVVKPDITAVGQLEGKKIATPQLGNTQDVALRAFLKDNGLASDTSGGGDVSIQPQPNGDALAAFVAGDLDGAWVPEPWATRLIQEGGGNVLVDERDLWPGGEYVTTHLLVRTEFLRDHPDVVKRLLQGVVDATTFVNENSEEAQRITNEGIEEITGKPIGEETLAAAWKNLTFTWDPIASSLERSKDAAVDVGLLDEVDLGGIYHLTLLNEVLEAAGEEPVEGLS